MQSLSSSLTPFTKFVLPGGFLAALPFLLFGVQDPKVGYIPALFWMSVCVFLVWWTASIKKVAFDGDAFLISNYRREIRVPVVQLTGIREDRGNRTPNIVLFFDPPTAFGRKIRIITPYELWRRTEFDRIAQLLRGTAEKNNERIQPLQRNAGSGPFPYHSSASENPSSLGPRC